MPYTPFRISNCKTCGRRAVVLDNEDSWAAGLVEDGLADMFIPIDFEEQEGLFDRVLAAIRQAEQVGKRPLRDCLPSCMHGEGKKMPPRGEKPGGGEI